MIRQMKMVMWVNPKICTPPHRVARPDQVVDLANAFSAAGWDPQAPALVGYRHDNQVQLLSGSHRWAAAMLAELEAIPVVVFGRWIIEHCWGDLEAWGQVMSPPPAGTSSRSWPGGLVEAIFTP